jgi:hypothetical protein
MQALLSARVRRCGAITLALAGFVARGASAQSSSPRLSMELAPGSRVRLTVPATKPFVGTLLGATSDSVQVQLASGSSVTLPLSGLSAIELSTGVRRHTYQGAALGFLSGAAVGGAIGFATYRRANCIDESLVQVFCSFVDGTSREVTVASDAALAGVIGGALGAMIGYRGHESWIQVPTLGARARVGMVRRSGVGISIEM